jgi:hypothetical protein
MMLAIAIDCIYGIATNRTYPIIDNDASAVIDATAAVAGVFLLGSVVGIVLSSMGKDNLDEVQRQEGGRKSCHQKR